MGSATGSWRFGILSATTPSSKQNLNWCGAKSSQADADQSLGTKYVTEQQYVRTASRLIEALKKWAEENGIPQSELALMLASAAGEIAGRQQADMFAGVELLRSVADTFEQHVLVHRKPNKRPGLLGKLRTTR